MKVVTVVGARPQFIKAAAVSAALTKAGIHEQLLHTGQHYDDNMSDVFFSELGIVQPAFRLDVGSGSHGAQTGKMLEGIEAVLMVQRPDWVLVYGDTNSTLAGALAASKLRIPVAHIEAGLRSLNRHMPEEINRILTDHMSSLLFAPTKTAVGHLRREGISDSLIERSGDVMYDVALHFAQRAQSGSSILSILALQPRTYCLATVHRAENTDDVARFEAIMDGLRLVAKKIPVVLPLHPRSRSKLGARRTDELRASGIRIVAPLGYLDMISLERNAAVIATDSGGVQKEAFFYRVPCVTLREETEWVETVSLGWNRLVAPISAEAVAAGIEDACFTTGVDDSPYGMGNAAGLIAMRLCNM